MPIKFEGVNTNLGKPDNMTDEECLGLPAQRGVDGSGFPYFLTGWMPNKEDLEALNRGEPIYLKVIGNGFPPVAMFTVDQEGELNV